MKVHHIGYLVKDIESATDKFIALGYQVEKPVYRDTFRKSDICFLRDGEYRVELISPYEAGSPVDNLIKKIRNAPYHICYVTDDIEADLKKYTEEGYLQISPIDPAYAIGQESKVVFLMNQDIGMIELVELNG